MSSVNQDAGTHGEVIAEAGVPNRAGQLGVDLDNCEAFGGKVLPVCRLGLPSCVFSYSDAGRSCSDSAQCEGSCWLAPPKQGESVRPGDLAVGVCQADSDVCGCHFEILDGVVQQGICVD